MQGNSLFSKPHALAIENAASPSDRSSSHPSFWDERYVRENALFGTAPNAFIRETAEHIPAGAAVVEVGAGEGRNLLFLAKTRGARITAMDFAEDGLRNARRRAEAAGFPLDTFVADARTWQPERSWDIVLVTFLHLLPHERPTSYHRLQEALCPGGRLLAEWFSTAHADKSRYAEIGPAKPDRLISARELRRHFPEAGIERLEVVDRELDEGPILQGRASVIRFVWQKPEHREASSSVAA